MIRLVRDLAKKSGKEVTLVMKGEETEIDRNMVEEIYEPLVHMIRNSCDHGLETPDERIKAGKDPTGTVLIAAEQKGGNIVIDIHDDGRGLDAQKIRAKGIERGIISADDMLDERAIYELIMHPGFSTKDTVTEVSGRGCGDGRRQEERGEPAREDGDRQHPGEGDAIPAQTAPHHGHHRRNDHSRGRRTLRGAHHRFERIAAADEGRLPDRSGKRRNDQGARFADAPGPAAQYPPGGTPLPQPVGRSAPGGERRQVFPIACWPTKSSVGRKSSSRASGGRCAT